ncbi:hypothetical protein [Chryseobacterium sp. SIMBA_038]|uniref:hypothetical protein n=1 Tax=Chryseobacterium sp. SIMBA_038 TaxID=3085780 RepID=UPI003978BE02
MIKKSLAIFILCISLFSCKKEVSKTSEIKQENDSIAKVETKEDLYKPIDTACSSQNKTEDYIIALQWYQTKTEKEIAENSPEQNDKLYEDYVKIRNKYIGCLSNTLGDVLEKYVNYYDSESESYKFPENIKKLTAEFKKGGLEFREVGEGYTEIWSKPDHYFSVFKNKVTPDYEAYVSQTAKENEGNYAADAGLIITWKELGDRLIFWENFINKYPKSPLISRVKEDYNNYLYDYLFGMDNTPTYENSDGKLYDENRAEFNRMIKKYPNSYIAKKAQELLNLFDSKTPTEQIREKINIERKY